MILTFALAAKGCEEKTFAFDTDADFSSFTLIADNTEVCFTVKREKRGGLYEYIPSFVAKAPVALDYARFYIDLPKVLDAAPENILVYESGACTNSFARLQPLDKYNGILTRDICMAHSVNGDVNFAFTTFERFYTCFHVLNLKMEATWHLENKTVNANEEYVLERFSFDDTLDGLEFFELYTDILAERYAKPKEKFIPCGWTSWSCLYGDINEEVLKKQAVLFADNFLADGADIFQSDDCWEEGGPFDAIWHSRKSTFPNGVKSVADLVRSKGMKFGIWISPALIAGENEKFNGHLNIIDGERINSFGNCVPMALNDDFVKEHVRESFEHLVKDYGVEYIKIDFLSNLLYRAGNGETPVYYEGGYSVELYKEFLRIIRKAVGEDVFLLGCSSPMGEAIGTMDSMRTSPDITWYGAGTDPNHPGTWPLLMLNAQNAVLRSPYNGKLFRNDADALLVRDFQTEHCSDGVHFTTDEAWMWTTVVAMSGGSVMLNEEVDRLPEERKEMFRQIITPLGKAARPKDFYEFPVSTETYVTLDDGHLVAVYNWTDDEANKTVDLSFYDEGEVFLADCRTKELIGIRKDSFDVTLKPHSARAFLIRKVRNENMFVFADDKFYLGETSVKARLEDGLLKIETDLKKGVYIYAPNETENTLVIDGKRFEKASFSTEHIYELRSE